MVSRAMLRTLRTRWLRSPFFRPLSSSKRIIADQPMSDNAAENPVQKFNIWLAEAAESEPNDPNAVALATATPDGRPTLRMVLLKDATESGFVFYTNLESRKGEQLRANPFAAMTFHWKTRRRQVRVEGPVEPVSPSEADAYFASRPRLSQIGAWASQQSRPLAHRFDLEKRVAEFTAKFHVGRVPRPDFWSGFRLVHQRIEFWEEREFRLHDRLVYSRAATGWHTEKLYP